MNWDVPFEVHHEEDWISATMADEFYLYFTIVDGDAHVVDYLYGYKLEHRSVRIPALISLDGRCYPVTILEDEALAYCDAWELVLPPTLTTIGRMALKNAKNLERLAIPASVRRIAKDAFDGCGMVVENLSPYFLYREGILYPQNLMHIIYVNKGIERAVLPEGLVEISEGCFEERKLLRKVEIPDSVVKIGDRAFRGCSGLNDVVLPKGLRELGKWGFGGCECLEELAIPKGVNVINEGLCSRCSALRRVRFEGEVWSIGEDAFYRTALEDVELNEGLKEIGQSAFGGCRSLKRINIPESVEVIRSCAFEDCIKLECMKLPEGLKRIGDGVFGSCLNLKQWNIPEGMESIGREAFGNCKRSKN